MNSLHNLSNGLLNMLQELPNYIDGLETSLYNIMVAFEEMVNSPNGYYQPLLKGQAGKDVAHFLQLFESYRDELIDESERIFEDKISKQKKLNLLWGKVVHTERLCTSHYENRQNENQSNNSNQSLLQPIENHEELKRSTDN